MSDETPSARKIGPREIIGGIALVAMGFGGMSWMNGRDIPWGYQQTFGAIAFGLGLLGAIATWFWPRPPTSE